MSNWSDTMPKPRSKFLRVRCPDCGNEQVIFDSATIIVKCNVCGRVLAEPSGGRAQIRGEVINIVE